MRVFGGEARLRDVIASLNEHMFGSETPLARRRRQRPFAPTDHEHVARSMPLTPDMRRSIDQIRDYLFGGGYPDPVSNAEQLSFLFFFYLVEGIDAENALRAQRAEDSRTTACSPATGR